VGNIGSTELLLILVLALLLLGPRRLPEIGAALGKTMRKFRDASRDLRGEMDGLRDLDPRRDLDLRRMLDDPPPPRRTTAEPSSPARDPEP
jgi:sec-independent protein translocase protein TatA